MLFSVSRASVRRPPDGPGDGPCPSATWCSPVQEGGFSELSANTRVCNHTEPPGRRRSLPTCWPQLRSDEDLPQPHGLAKRYVEQHPALFPPFVITRVRTPVRERQEGGLGWRSLRSGRTFGDSITSRLGPARPSSPISQPCLPSSMLRMICVFRITSPQFFRTLPHHPPAPTSPALTPRPIYLSLLPILPFDIIPNRIDTNTAASSQPTSSRSST